ncbi:MAG: methyl-accepting chemotaxis protein [Angelakisella sp.]
MKNLKIAQKFVITFGVIIALLLATVFVSITSLNSVGQNFTYFYNQPYQVTTRVMAMRRAIQAAGKNVGYATMTDDITKTGTYIDACQEELSTLKEGITFLYENFSGDKALVDTFKATMDASITSKEKVFENARKNNNEVAAKIFFEEYQPFLLAANANLLEISAVSENRADTLYAEANTAKNNAFIVLVVVSGVALALTIILAVYLTKSLTKPILEIEKAANKMADGDLSVVISYSSKDELGSLSHRMAELVHTLKAIIGDVGYILGAMADGNFRVTTKVEDKYVGDYKNILLAMRGINRNLSSALTQINQSSDQVASGSDQVSSGAQALSQGATEQASAIEELSATITEISAQIKANADNAQIANSLSDEAGMGVDESNQKMQEMIVAMGEISGKSNEIGKIIKTIDDIAFQTNILALNAAVEAARAGAAGKGFAVVADEVRNLAQKSAEAAKNTTALIEDTVNAVENGTKIADDTAKSLEMVVEKSGMVGDKINEIAAASDAQANAIIQVTMGIDQISSVVQTNSATSEESAAASEELSGQAQMLKELVGKFKLRDINPIESNVDQTEMLTSGSGKY